MDIVQVVPHTYSHNGAWTNHFTFLSKDKD